jgi:hypothetical protein
MNDEKIICMAREWLPKAYRDGDVGDEPKFTKHNMEVAFAAGVNAERNSLLELFDTEKDKAFYGRHITAIIQARGVHD